MINSNNINKRSKKKSTKRKEKPILITDEVTESWQEFLYSIGNHNLATIDGIILGETEFIRCGYLKTKGILALINNQWTIPLPKIRNKKVGERFQLMAKVSYLDDYYYYTLLYPRLIDEE